MAISNLETLIRNFCFISLFLTMIFYWIKGGFFYTKKTINLEIFLLSVPNVALISILIIRWIISNHFPLSNLYESLIFLSWSLLTVLLFLIIKTEECFLGIILTPIVLFINTFATLTLPLDMQKATSLVPALQSNWLMMHVTIMMLSYAALISGSLLSITFLFLNFFSEKNKIVTTNWNQKIKSIDSTIVLNKNNVSNVSFISNFDFFPTVPETESTSIKNVAFIDKLDTLSYRTIGIGFPLLTIGILSGAVWANETWGSYWNWDPKETWAFITWLIYSIYLHSRIIKGEKGKQPALIASFGFLAVWICYLGVNLFGKGLHSYGWFS